MTTAIDWRRLALALPEVCEGSHFGKADFRVAGKIFAGLSADESTGTLKLLPEIQASLVGCEGEDAPFTPCAGAWGRSGWTFVDLARVDLAVVEALVGEAWRLVAPKRLSRIAEASEAAPATKTRSSVRKRTRPK